MFLNCHINPVMHTLQQKLAVTKLTIVSQFIAVVLPEVPPTWILGAQIVCRTSETAASLFTLHGCTAITD